MQNKASLILKRLTNYRRFSTTLSGVDEKPQNEAPVQSLYRGFLFYSLLTAPGALLGYKVAPFFDLTI